MPKEKTHNDLVAKPTSFLLAWGIPLLILFSMNFAQGIIPIEAIILIMVGLLAWMGLGCILNARRCHRRHCYYSGPIFLIGAAGVLLVGFKVISIGPDGLFYIVNGTVVLVALTFVSELIWGKYVTR